MLFENWTIAQHSPTIHEDETGDMLQLIYYCTWDNLFLGMPEINSFYPGDLQKYADAYLTTVDIRNADDGALAHITLTYKTGEKGSGGTQIKKIGTTEYTCSASALEKSLRSHPDWKPNWTHHLCKKVGTEQAQPNFLLSTTLEVANEDDDSSKGPGWAWLEDLSEKGDNWSIPDGLSKTKRAEVYIVGSVTVHKRQYYTRQSSANSAASSVGTLATPGNTFGLGGSGHWLVNASNVFFEDGFWVAEVDYLYADEWDSDLYG